MGVTHGDPCTTLGALPHGDNTIGAVPTLGHGLKAARISQELVRGKRS